VGVTLIAEDGSVSKCARISPGEKLGDDIRYVLSMVEADLPLGTRDKPKMKQFIAHLKPGYVLPGQARVLKVLHAIDDTQRNKVDNKIARRKELSNGTPGFSFMFDFWSKRHCAASFLSHRVVWTAEDEDGKLQFYNVVIGWHRMEKSSHTARAIGRALVSDHVMFDLNAQDFLHGAPDGDASGLKACRVHGLIHDPCILHQIDCSVRHATGEAGKNGGMNPLSHAHLRRHRLLSSKIRSSIHLQSQLRQLQLQYVTGNEVYVVETYGQTRWQSMFILLARNLDLRSIIERLEETSTMDISANGDDSDDELFMGEHDRYDSADDGHEEAEEEVQQVQQDEEELSALIAGLALKNIRELMPTPEEWEWAAVFEALMDPVREAVTRLQPGHYNMIHETLSILVKIRRHFTGDNFTVAIRPSDYRAVRQGDYPCEVRSRAAVFAACPFAEPLCTVMVDQFNARFFHRKMPKWIYIEAILNVSNYKLEKLFEDMAVTLDEAWRMLRTEMLDVVRTFFPGADEVPVATVPAARGGRAGGSGSSRASGSAQAGPKTVRRSEMKTALRGDFSSDESDDESLNADAPAPAPVLLSKMEIELKKLEELRSARGKIYAMSAVPFKINEFFDTDYRKDFLIARKLHERGQSVVLDEAQCERDFNKSGGVFTALRERMLDSTGELLVRIPLRDATFPVTVEEVKLAYVQMKRGRKGVRKTNSRAVAAEMSALGAGGPSSSDSDASSGSDDSSASDDSSVSDDNSGDEEEEEEEEDGSEEDGSEEDDHGHNGGNTSDIFVDEDEDLSE
jgi:hypothetical protein